MNQLMKGKEDISGTGNNINNDLKDENIYYVGKKWKQIDISRV